MMTASGPRSFAKLASTAMALALLAGSASAQRAVAPAVPGGQALAPTVLKPDAALRISGHVRGLFPGAKVWMPVRVRSVTGVSIRLTGLRATVGAPSVDCPSSMLRVRPLREQPVVAARRTLHVRLRVRLRRIAPEACQGVRFPLTFSAQGVPA